MVFPSPDEDRLSKRKSIGETISLQVEMESRNSPEREEVKYTDIVYRYLLIHILSVTLCCCALQRTPAEEITFETLKNAIGEFLLSTLINPIVD